MTLRNEQSAWIREAYSHVSPNALAEITSELVDIASPTGEEANLARMIVRRLNDHDLDGHEQVLDGKQSNAVGKLPGSGGAPSLLLYAPLDTVTSGDPIEDLPWAAAEMPPEMWAKSRVADGHVFGLGAHNPKGHAACIIAAAQALRAARVPLKGDLLLGFGAGGMPTNARNGMHPDSGHGVGCARMLSEMQRPDQAVIAKSGWSVSWEEVGLAWYEVRVFGTHTYVGSRHLLPYVNAIAQAAKIIEQLEGWFEIWAEQHRSGLVAPQGIISFIEAGWERMPAFTPAMCRFRLDLRLSPRTSALEADRAIAEQLELLAARFNVPVQWERLVAIPGTTTSPDHLIIRNAIAAWEAIEGRPHIAVTGLSGATDANILRAHGIATARIGLPKAAIANRDFQRGMNTVAIVDLLKLTQHLIHTTVITTC
jgi:succinyl-diaminopimelate desuccinylase